MRTRLAVLWIVVGILLVGTAGRSAAQQCEDGNACTTDDMCSDGVCSGTPVSSGNCDDGNECTTNDHCTPDGCMGDPGTVGTACAGGCGTCAQLVPIPGAPLLCAPSPGKAGQPCDVDAGPCFEATCQVFGVPPAQVAACIPAPVDCPDTDGNPCTDACNFQTGQCEKNASKCFPICETCNSSTGACEPANEGASCDDFNDCTSASRCEAVDVGGTMRGLCTAGEPTITIPTATVTPGGPTPTTTPTVTPGGPTPTPVPPGPCVGDCGQNGEVSLGEVQISFNVFLGTALLDTCPKADDGGDDEVSLGEVQKAFLAFLNGCV